MLISNIQMYCKLPHYLNKDKEFFPENVDQDAFPNKKRD